MFFGEIVIYIMDLCDPLCTLFFNLSRVTGGKFENSPAISSTCKYWQQKLLTHVIFVIQAASEPSSPVFTELRDGHSMLPECTGSTKKKKLKGVKKINN